MITPKEICLERNKNRDRIVPVDVIERKNNKLAESGIDTELDLFDEIIAIDKDGIETKIYNREIQKEKTIIGREMEIVPKLKLK